jgi:catechol 2,3-dioxygenase-like lactoylglutathione lyase family enzyme
MKVKSIEESISFYQKHFGLELKEKGLSQSFGKPYAIIGVSETLMLCIYEEENIQHKQGISHFGLYIENFSSAEEYLRSQDVEIMYGGPILQGKSHSLYIIDPSGHEIELVEKVCGAL